MNVAYNIDCMEYMKTLPDNAFDLAVVDPPYGDGLAERERETASGGTGSGNGSTVTRRSHLVCGLRKGDRQPDWWNMGGEVRKKIIAWDTAPKQEYFDELFRVSRNQIIWGGNYFDLPPTRCFLIWRKTNVPLEGFSMAPAEYAWTSFNENAKVFEFSAVGQQGRFHPTQKPPELYRWVYKHFANDGDKILDTHLGSGSSRLAAYDAGLDFVGCEIDTEYFKLEEERFERHTAQMNLFLEDFT